MGRRTGGLTFCSTINRTAKAFTLSILGAEYIMNWLLKAHVNTQIHQAGVVMTRMLKDADKPLSMTYNASRRQLENHRRRQC